MACINRRTNGLHATCGTVEPAAWKSAAYPSANVAERRCIIMMRKPSSVQNRNYHHRDLNYIRLYYRPDGIAMASSSHDESVKSENWMRRVSMLCTMPASVAKTSMATRLPAEATTVPVPSLASRLYA